LNKELSLGDQRERPATPRQSLQDLHKLLEEGLHGEGLTCAIYTDAGPYWTNTDAHRVSAMLFAVENRLPIDRFGDLYLHYGRRMPPCGKTAANVQRLVQTLKQRRGLRFAILWHINGETDVHLDCSAGMTFEEIEEHVERLAREEWLEGALAEAR
jgi:hypothetical protein